MVELHGATTPVVSSICTKRRLRPSRHIIRHMYLLHKFYLHVGGFTSVRSRPRADENRFPAGFEQNKVTRVVAGSPKVNSGTTERERGLSGAVPGARGPRSCCPGWARDDRRGLRRRPFRTDARTHGPVESRRRLSWGRGVVGRTRRGHGGTTRRRHQGRHVECGRGRGQT